MIHYEIITPAATATLLLLASWVGGCGRVVEGLGRRRVVPTRVVHQRPERVEIVALLVVLRVLKIVVPPIVVCVKSIEPIASIIVVIPIINVIIVIGAIVRTLVFHSVEGCLIFNVWNSIHFVIIVVQFVVRDRVGIIFI